MASELVPNIQGSGGPSRYAKAFSYVLNNLIGGQVAGAQINQATSDAEQKALQANLVQQPEGSAAGMTDVPDLTDEEKLLQSMRDVGGGSTKADVFD